MKKLFAILCVALVSSVMVVGCGGDKKDTKTATPSGGTAPATPSEKAK